MLQIAVTKSPNIHCCWVIWYQVTRKHEKLHYHMAGLITKSSRGS